MSDAGHRSIGEVLALLQEEFPDITISKIRFLESQGLIDPERTPSGYRKFTDADVARLRWILRQQRESFLPLKVIKERLEDPALLAELDAEAHGQVPTETGDLDDPEPEAALPEPEVGARRSILDPLPPVSLTIDELCRETGLSARNVGELERYGLLGPDGSGGTYGYDALVVARAAAALRAQGVEARHLRMYKVAAEREAGYYEQLLMPMLKGKGARGRRDAGAALDALLAQGDEIRAALLRQAFRDHFPRG